MKTSRLEAFSDGVFAVIITIMVLEMKVPHGADLAALRPVLPVFLSYVLSFIILGTYWNNHHHMLQAVRQIRGPSLWANLHLLFWLSLIPFVTDWMGENNFATWPVVLYGIVLICAGCAYTMLERSLIKYEGAHSKLAVAVGREIKGKMSVLLYAIAIPVAFVRPWLSCSIYVVIVIIWLVPDRRIERTLQE
jgi:uncharacterized membrane protein